MWIYDYQKLNSILFFENLVLLLQGFGLFIWEVWYGWFEMEDGNQFLFF